MSNFIIKQIPVFGQAISFTRTAIKVYKCSDPVNATLVTVKSIIDDCLLPQIVKWSVLVTQIAVVCLSGGYPFNVSVAIAAVRQIISPSEWKSLKFYDYSW